MNKAHHATEIETMNSRNFFANGYLSLRLLFKEDSRMSLIYIGISFFQAISWVLQVLVLQWFFDKLSAFSMNEINFSQILLTLSGLALIYILYHVMDGLGNCYEEIFGLSVAKHLNQLTFKRIGKLKAAEFEDTKRLEFINKSINGSAKMIWVASTLLDIIFYYTSYFVFMSWYLFTLKPILAVSIVAVFVPCILTQLVRVSAFKNLEDESAPLRREYEYYEKCLTNKDSLKETRLLGVTSFFSQLYYSSLERLNSLVFRVELKKSLINFTLSIGTVIGYGVILYMLFTSVMNREITIGAFAAVLASIANLYRFMNKLISERIAWATENIGSTENFLDFISEPISNQSVLPRPQHSDIKLKDVRFKYPMTDRWAVQGINLTITDKQTLAIVGENGSGKTTLCRVIMGLYHPSEGEVTYGDVRADRVSHDNMSVVFQNYCRYAMSLSENIRISQIDEQVVYGKVESACKDAGIHLGHELFLKEGIHTKLGREFGGVDLSGGQWQRIAIARGLYRTSEFIVLDEPTAAIDPLEETRLYNDFAKICENKTAIIVSHRLGSVKLADRIIVMKAGRIVQDGTHEQLMAQEGEYRTMYSAQEKWYS
ncbi:ABC transporter ATP-binding protein [Paenibacillus senegalimassiliensis]|uniref:ABC transporter ATP-binding protein n=1 Tax=Paenibacillus senegalimassiliensis TaxID=1737426 RepID=UPI00073EAD44|nr:ATP-binding cassette domain-containing protein [Paenibacillus senegalimassiliensis]